MNFHFKKAIFCLFSLIIFWSLFISVDQALAGVVLSTPKADPSYGLNETVGQGNLKDAFSVSAVDQNTPGQFLSTRIGQIIGAILSFIGVLLLVLIVYAGILWMTSNGNEKNVEQAKNIIVSAIIGLIIVLSAYAITAFVGRQLTNAPAQVQLQTQINNGTNVGIGGS